MRGYPSLNFQHNAATELQTATHKVKHSCIFYSGDYDPGGLDIYRKIGEDLQEFVPNVSMVLNRVAVTSQQIRAWNLLYRGVHR